MKKLSILFSLWLVLFCSLYSSSQTINPYVFYNNTAFGSATTGVIVNNTASGATYHKVTWTVTGGTFTTATLKVDSCTTSSPASCNDGDILGATDAHLSGSSLAINFVAAYSRVRLTVYTAATGTPTLNVIYTGYINNPAGGGTPAGAANQVQINNGAGAFGGSNCTIGVVDGATLTDAQYCPGGFFPATQAGDATITTVGTGIKWTGGKWVLATTTDVSNPTMQIASFIPDATHVYPMGPGQISLVSHDAVTEGQYILLSPLTNGQFTSSSTCTAGQRYFGTWAITAAAGTRLANINPGMCAPVAHTTATFLVCAAACALNETTNWKFTAASAVTFTSCWIDAVTYPTGAGSTTVDILKNVGGTSIFTAAPALAGGAVAGNNSATLGAGAALSAGDYLIAKVTSVAGTITGQFINVVCTN